MPSNQVLVLFFGQIAEYTMVNQVVLTDFYDTNAIMTHLKSLYPKLKETPFQLALDQEIIHENTALPVSHTLALLPPYAGG